MNASAIANSAGRPRGGFAFLRRGLHLFDAVWRWSCIVALALGLAFPAWRIPGEREEDRIYRQEVHRDDGPHVFWMDENRLKVVTARYDRGASAYSVDERLCDRRDAASIPASIRDLLETPPAGEAEEAEARVAAVSDVHGQFNGAVPGRSCRRRSGALDFRHDLADRGALQPAAPLARAIAVPRAVDAEEARQGGSRPAHVG